MTTPTLTRVCALSDLTVERGSAALVTLDGTATQIALFRLHDDEVLAVQQLDPYSGANVMSRGLVGTRDGEPTVAGPVYKQVFALRTGKVLDAAGYSPQPGHAGDLTPYDVVVRDGDIYVGARNTTSDYS